MAEILPFRALQYFRDRVPIEKVVTQPYDKISSEMQDRYRASHPNNLVRVLRPASEPGQEAGQSPYERAASILRQWRRDGVLEKVSEPSLFAYFEQFRVPGRMKRGSGKALSDCAGWKTTKTASSILTSVRSADRKPIDSNCSAIHARISARYS